MHALRFQHVSIGRECIIADRMMIIDFDHGFGEVERPIRLQGSRSATSGRYNVWIGYGAAILHGVTSATTPFRDDAVVTRDVADNAVVAGIPARVIRMRDAPKTFRWG